MPSPADQPGWLPDPERPGMVRWWNGLGWSDARRTADGVTDRAQQLRTEAMRGSTVTPQQVARTVLDKGAARAVPAAAAGTNAFAGAAVGLGVLGFGLGFGGIVPLIALILAIAGLVRSRRLAAQGSKRTGLGQSLVGLVFSIVGLIRWLPLLGTLPDMLQNLLNS
jgi:hypothetical protein